MSFSTKKPKQNLLGTLEARVKTSRVTLQLKMAALLQEIWKIQIQSRIREKLAEKSVISHLLLMFKPKQLQLQMKVSNIIKQVTWIWYYYVNSAKHVFWQKTEKIILIFSSIFVATLKLELTSLLTYKVKRQDIILQYYNIRSIQVDDNPESSTFLLFSSDFNEPSSGIFHSSQNPSTFQELSKRNRRRSARLSWSWDSTYVLLP